MSKETFLKLFQKKDVQKLVSWMDEFGLEELEWEETGKRLKLRKRLNRSEKVLEHTLNSKKEVASSSLSPAPSYLKKVVSPLVGVFYRASAPEEKPYVEINKHVHVGDVLCIVEAMKLMNEIESEVSGKIVSIFVQDGQAVQYGDPLFEIDTRA